MQLVNIFLTKNDNMQDELKRTVSSRVDPMLESLLMQQAKEAGVSKSNFIENLLKDHLLDGVDIEEELEEDLDSRVEEYEDIGEVELEEDEEEFESDNRIAIENGNSLVEQKIDSLTDLFKNEFATLKKALNNESTPIQELQDENKTSVVHFDLDVFEKEELTSYLEKLKAKYPDYSDSKILLASVYVAMKNEDSYLASKISDHI